MYTTEDIATMTRYIDSALARLGCPMGYDDLPDLLFLSDYFGDGPLDLCDEELRAAADDFADDLIDRCGYGDLL